MRNNQVSVTWCQDDRDIKTELRRLKNTYLINQAQFCHSAIADKIDSFLEEREGSLVRQWLQSVLRLISTINLTRHIHMNQLPPTHKKILMEINRITKIPMDRILFDALMNHHKFMTGRDFKLWVSLSMPSTAVLIGRVTRTTYWSRTMKNSFVNFVGTTKEERSWPFVIGCGSLVKWLMNSTDPTVLVTLWRCLDGLWTDGWLIDAWLTNDWPTTRIRVGLRSPNRLVKTL